jgi:molybdate transport system regulatory protein
MNILKGYIERIKVNGDLSIVNVNVAGFIFSTIVIDTPQTASFLKVKNDVKIIFKETEVIIGVGDMSGISLRNKMVGTVTRIDADILLSKLTMKTEIGEISSIITSNAVKQLKIKLGMEVTAMVKTNEIILSK